MSNETVRRTLPLVVTIVVALIMFLDYYTGAPVVVDFSRTITSWSVVIGLFGQLLGVVALISINARHLQKKTPKRWYFSIMMLATLFLFLAIGLATTASGAIYQLMYNNIVVPLESAMMGVLGFYFIIGGYKAFRGFSLDVAAFMLSLLAILLMLAPIATAIWPGFTDIGGWIQLVPNRAAQRGVLIGVSLGAIVLAFNTLLGRERGYLGG